MEEQRLQEVARIISEKLIYPVYQPIVSLKDGSIYAYEALSRITAENTSLNIMELFEGAGRSGYLWELEKICRTKALKHAVEKPEGMKLFINVDGNILRDSKFIKGFTKEKLGVYSLKTKDVVFEITERSDYDDPQLLSELIKHYREQGYEVALDDLGSGYSGLNRLQNIKPEYVKVDYELIHDIDKDKSKKSLLRMLVRHCNDMDYKLIAEGIETKEELQCLINLGVKYGQGFLLGMPDKEFQNIDPHVIKLIEELQKSKKKSHSNKIGNIGKMGTIVYPTCSVEHAMTLFSQAPRIPCIAIVDSECKFYGFIYRDEVMRYADDKQKSRLTVEGIMDPDILKIDADKTIKETIGRLMIREEQEFYKPFAIIRKHRYFGVATIRDVLIAIGKEL